MKLVESFNPKQVDWFFHQDVKSNEGSGIRQNIPL